MDSSQLPESRVAKMITEVAAYLQKERSLHLRASAPLGATWKTMLERYFRKTLLDTLKTVVLEGARIPRPAFLRRSSGHEFRQGFRISCLSLL